MARTVISRCGRSRPHTEGRRERLHANVSNKAGAMRGQANQAKNVSRALTIRGADIRFPGTVAFAIQIQTFEDHTAMRNAMIRKVLWASVVVAAAAALLGTSTVGQETKEKKAKGKLPAYYADIVTEAQRAQIYAVQEKYAKQVGDLQAQLDAVTKQRDTEIESLLNADQ